MLNGLQPPADLVKNNNTSNIETIGIIIAILAISFCIIYIFMMFYFAFYKKTGMKLFIRRKKTNNTKKYYNCPICGEETEEYCGNPRQDKLCRVHAAMLRDNQIALCKYCGSWYKTDAGCKCQQLDQE